MEKARFTGLLTEDLANARCNQKELASAIGVREDQISQWKAPDSSSKPTQEQLRKIVKFFSDKGVKLSSERVNAYWSCFDYPLPDPPPVVHAGDPQPSGDIEASGNQALVEKKPGGKRFPWVHALAAVCVCGILALAVSYFIFQPAVMIRHHDFEKDSESWGRHITGGSPHSDGVGAYCGEDPKAHSGRCSLEISFSDLTDEDVYATANAAGLDSGSEVEAYVNVRGQASSCTKAPPIKCITARLILWDADNKSWEGGDVQFQLQPATFWYPLKLSIKESWPRPFRSLGIHFYRPSGLGGPVYIDAVRIAQ